MQGEVDKAGNKKNSFQEDERGTYIGERSCSLYERAKERQKDRDDRIR